MIGLPPIESYLKRTGSVTLGSDFPKELNPNIDRSQYDTSFGDYENEGQKPEIEEFIKLTQFESNMFQYKWVSLIFLCNIYNYFTALYFMGLQGFPEGLWLSIEIIVEFIFIIDVIIRLYIYKESTFQRWWMLNDALGFPFIWLSSIPISFVLIRIDFDYSAQWVAALRLVKLLRFFQIQKYLHDMETVHRKMQQFVVVVFKLFLILGGLTHFSAMLWLIVARNEIEQEEDETWYQDWDMEKGTQFEIYVDAWFWATATMTSIGYGDITPLTKIEKLFSLLVMIIGATTYGALFGTFVFILDKLNESERENRQLLEETKIWAKLRGISEDKIAKISYYYNFVRLNSAYIKSYQALHHFPLSLKTEISMYVYEDLIQKSSLFEIGDPTFIMALVRYLKPSLHLAGDQITRQGEFAESFYFIKSGDIDVFAADDENLVLVRMTQGGFLGEVGILVQDTRSVTTKAVGTLLLSYIEKKDLLNILENFPDHYEYLEKVALQRLNTTYKSDVDLFFDFDWQRDEQEAQMFEILGDQKAPIPFWRRNWFFRGSKTFSCQIIEPFSRLSKIWAVLVIIVLCYNLFYVPISIAFEYTIEDPGLLTIDVIAVAINAFDIFIRMNKGFINENGQVEKSPANIRQIYLKSGLFLDILAAFPADYIAYGSPQWVSGVLRILRLLKARQVWNLLQELTHYSSSSMMLFNLSLYFVLFIYLNHISAWFMFLIGRLQYQEHPYARFDNRTWFSVFGDASFNQFDPLLSLSYIDQYIHSLYWAYATCGTVAYGDIIPVTPAEKIYAFVIMIVAKVFTAFIYAEAASVVSSYHSAYTKHTQKKKTIKRWMAHVKLQPSLQLRVQNYLDLLWDNLQGHDDHSVKKELPESLQTEIAIQLFSKFSESKVFPTDIGAMIMVVQHTEIIMVCTGEYILQAGEIGLEMYFILEGTADVISKDGVFLASLEPGAPFGEIALLPEVPVVRNANVIACCNMSLGILKYADFAKIMEKYSEFNRNMRKTAWNREVKNRHRELELKKAFEEKEDEASAPSSLSDNHNGDQIVVLNSSKMSSGKIRVNSQNTSRHSEINSSSSESDDEALESLVDEKQKSEEVETGTPTIPDEARGGARRTSRFAQPQYTVDDNNMTLNLHVQVKTGCRTAMIEFLMREQNVVYANFSFALWNLIFIPLQIAFEIEFKGVFLAFEVLTMFYYICWASWYLLNGIKEKNTEEKLKKLLLAAHLMLITFPFALLFSFEPGSRPLVVILSLIRIIHPLPFTRFFSYLTKEYLSLQNLLRIQEVLFYYLILAHFMACMWIEMSKIEDDDQKSWLRRIPVPRPTGTRTEDAITLSNETIYVHAIYWSIVSFSHIGIGDITAISVPERAFNCFAVLVFTFAYSVLFGNMASLVNDMVTQLNSTLHLQYQFVLSFLNKKDLKQFRMRVDEYFHHVWFVDLGINETEILSILPIGLQCDIRLARYSYLIQRCGLFKAYYDEPNIQLCRSILRLMDISYYPTGSHVISQNDAGSGLFIILDGEVIVIEQDIHTETLETSDYFGDMSVFLNIKKSMSDVSCSKMCKIGHIDMKNMDLLKCAFPDWTQTMQQKTYEKYQEKLDEADVTTMQENKVDFNIFKIRRSETLRIITKSEIDLLDKRRQLEQRFIPIDIIHTIDILYTMFALSMTVAFDLDANTATLMLECICVAESWIYLLLNFRLYYISEYSMKEIFKMYYENGLVLDLIACSPLNAILWGLDITDPLWLVAPLRLLRIITIARIPPLLTKIEVHYLQLSVYLYAFKALLFLFSLWHFSSCIWFWANNSLEDKDVYRWIQYNELENENLQTQYLFSIYFTMNIVTSVGYGDMFGTNDTERILTCVVILTGDALFAVAFGMMASIAASQEDERKKYLLEITEARDLLSSYSIPEQLLKRMEQYYAYRWAMKRITGDFEINEMYENLPRNMVEQLMYECHSHVLRNVPIFDIVSDMYIQQMSTHLRPEIYLPGDYIIYKGDIGEEMFFIIQGGVDILSQDDKTITKQLGISNYIGEVAMLKHCRRTKSVVANTFSLLLVLQKEDFEALIMTNKAVKDSLQVKGDERMQENSPTPTNVLGRQLSVASQTSEMSPKKMLSVDYIRSQSRRLSGQFIVQPDKKNVYMEQQRRPTANYANERRFSTVGAEKELVISAVSKIRTNAQVQLR